MMSTIDVGTSFTLSTSNPTATFLRLRPGGSVTNSILAIFDELGNDLPVVTEPDWTANGAAQDQHVDRLMLPSGTATVRFSATVEVDELLDPMPSHLCAPAPAELRPEHWWWLQPSRYCRPDELGAEAWEKFGGSIGPNQSATGQTVRNICSYVNDEMTFAYGSTTAFTSASDAWAQRRGVCRDFNHIAASFCRALNIPTRYVFGYLPNVGIIPSGLPMDFSAWIEVCLEDTWWTFDARVNEPRIGRIVVARGRDAADVPLISTLGATILNDFVVTAAARHSPMDVSTNAAG